MQEALVEFVLQIFYGQIIAVFAEGLVNLLGDVEPRAVVLKAAKAWKYSHLNPFKSLTTPFFACFELTSTDWAS